MKRVIVGIAIAGGLTFAGAGAASADDEPLPKWLQNCISVIDRQNANGQTGANTGSDKDPKAFDAVTNCDRFWIAIGAIGPNKS